jgi:hypothetical protein
VNVRTGCSSLVIIGASPDGQRGMGSYCGSDFIAASGLLTTRERAMRLKFPSFLEYGRFMLRPKRSLRLVQRERYVAGNSHHDGAPTEE